MGIVHNITLDKNMTHLLHYVCQRDRVWLIIQFLHQILDKIPVDSDVTALKCLYYFVYELKFILKYGWRKINSTTDYVELWSKRNMK